jgi:hypothetical protein
LEFDEITDGFPIHVGNTSVDLQICENDGQAVVWATSANTILNVITGDQTAIPTSDLVVMDCYTLRNYFLYRGNTIDMYKNDANNVLSETFTSSIGKLMASAGKKTYPIVVEPASVGYYPFDAQIPFLTIPFGGNEKVLAAYGVISSRNILSTAFVRLEGTLVMVQFYGFDTTDYANVPADGRAEYLPADFNFTVSNSPSDMRFVEYPNILYYSYQNSFDETYIQSIPSGHSGSYKIGGDGNKLKAYTMIGMGKDNSTLLLAYIYLTGQVFVALWDSTATIGFAPKDLSLQVDVSSMSNEPIGLFRVNDTHAELYLAFKSQIIKYSLHVVGDNSTSGYEDVIVVDTLLVNASTVVGDLILGENSTLVINDGAVITVSGCATLNGTLVIVLNNGTIQQVFSNGSINIVVMELVCRDGDFNEIQIQGDLGDCYDWNADPNYSPTQLTLVISTTNNGWCPVDYIPDYTGLIIGVVIGGAALVVGILLLSLYFSPLRAKVFPYARK